MIELCVTSVWGSCGILVIALRVFMGKIEVALW